MTNSDTSFEFAENKDGLSVLCTNADNLMNKIDELKVRLHLKPFDVLVVYHKTGKSDDIQLSELHINGYNIYRLNVKAHCRGVVIYISDHISSKIVLDLTNHQFSKKIMGRNKVEYMRKPFTGRNL